MKKIIALVISLVCALALGVCAFAYEAPGQKLEVKLFCEVDGKYYFADVAEGKSDEVGVGETLNLVFNDFSDLRSMNSSGDMKFGVMLVDDENGEGEVTYHISDVTVKSSGQSDHTVSAEGTYTDKLRRGIYEDDTAVVHEFNVANAAMNSSIGSLGEISLSVNYISYNDTGLSTAEAVPEEEETLPEPPATGISYSILPLCAAVVALAVTGSKR